MLPKWKQSMYLVYNPNDWGMIALPFFLFMHVTQKTATVETCNNMGSYLEQMHYNGSQKINQK